MKPCEAKVRKNPMTIKHAKRKIKTFHLFLFLILCCLTPKKIKAETLYPVSRIELVYTVEHSKKPPLAELEQVPLHLSRKASVFYGKEGMKSNQRLVSIAQLNASGKTFLFSKEALEQILKDLFAYFEKKNINWTYLYLSSEEIDSQGKDIRPPSDTQLTIWISVPIISDMQIQFSDPNHSDRMIDYPKQKKRIDENFPCCLSDPTTGFEGDFINSTLLNNYLHALNRHPGRRVDLEIGPASNGIPGEVAFDFIVSEPRPWHVYFNANNNVPKVIDRWQESIGFIHTQLTGNDDILKLDASTDSFDRLYQFSASYEAPLGRTIGTRWQLSSSYSRFVSAEFALPQNLFVGTQAIVTGEIATNLAQWGRLFLDFVADLQYRHIHNTGHFLFSSATKNFLLPSLGLKMVQLKREMKWIASLSVQSSMSSLFWDVKKHLDNLGRQDISPNWAIVQGGLYGSFYLEPLFNPPEKVKRLAHEITLIGQFQNACNQRLIPELEGILGGLYTVRGYPQSTIAGDNSYMGSIEYRLHIPQLFRPRTTAKTKLFGKSFQWAPDKPKGNVDWDLLLRGFYDIGQTTVNQKKSREKNHLIMGAGIGLELVMWQNIFIRGDFGHGFKAANGIDAGNNEFYFSSTFVY